MAKLYRVEDAERRGMYNSDYVIETVFGSSMENPRHPMPHNDSGLKKAGLSTWMNKHVGKGWAFWDGPPNNRIRYGFASLEQLKSWLYKDEWRHKLKELDYSIGVYEADDMIAGDTQAIATADSMHYLDRLDLELV